MINPAAVIAPPTAALCFLARRSARIAVWVNTILLELYQTTIEPRWFVAAQELVKTMLTHFQAPEGGFYDTSDDHETLITRPRNLFVIRHERARGAPLRAVRDRDSRGGTHRDSDTLRQFPPPYLLAHTP
jgi:hypothetical protein